MSYGQAAVGPTETRIQDCRVASPARDSQVTVAMTRLQLAVEQAELHANVVTKKLDPVLNRNPQPTNGETKADGRNGQCDLASTIHGACERLETLNRHWEDIGQRCEV